MEAQDALVSLSRPDHRTLTEATADTLRNAIQNEVFVAGSQLPPELELMNRLGVSRTTLREALRELEVQGLIVRRRGKGTFVAERSIVKDLSCNFGITEMISQAGFTPGTLNVIIRLDKSTPATANELNIPEGSRVIILDRVRTADDMPVVWSLDVIPTRLVKEEDIPALRAWQRSLYEYLQENHHVNVTHGEAKIKPVLASAEIALKLQIKRGDPVLLITQTDYDSADQPVIHSVEYHLADKFVFLVNRKGPTW